VPLIAAERSKYDAIKPNIPRAMPHASQKWSANAPIVVPKVLGVFMRRSSRLVRQATTPPQAVSDMVPTAVRSVSPCDTVSATPQRPARKGKRELAKSATAPVTAVASAGEPLPEAPLYPHKLVGYHASAAVRACWRFPTYHRLNPSKNLMAGCVRRVACIELWKMRRRLLLPHLPCGLEISDDGTVNLWKRTILRSSKSEEECVFAVRFGCHCLGPVVVFLRISACAKHGFPPHSILPHGSYLINCGSANPDMWKKSR
jgi:hypothetical protein